MPGTADPVLGSDLLTTGAALAIAAPATSLPVAFLFVGTALAAFVFLRVGGESDALFIYAFVYGPLVLAGELLGALLETVVRATVIDRFVSA